MTTKVVALQDESTTNKIFYNMTLLNPTSQNIPMSFNENLQSFILLEKPSNYELSIVRFSLSMFDVPLFTYQPNQQKITMAFGIYKYGEFVPFISRANVPIGSPYYYGIYEVTQYMQMLNQAIQDCCDMLDAQYYLATSSHLSIVTSTIPNPSYNPLQPITPSNLEFIQTFDKPYFTYDKVNQLISAYANKTFYEDTVTNGYTLSINEILFTKIQGLDIIDTGIAGEEFNILFHNNFNNVVGNIIENKQQSFNMNTFSDFKSVRIMSNLNTQLEYEKAGAGQNVLADYIPLAMSVRTFHDNLIYNSIVPYRQVQVKTDLQFNSLSLDCYRTDSNNNSILLQLPPNASSSIKLMFQLKRTSKY